MDNLTKPLTLLPFYSTGFGCCIDHSEGANVLEQLSYKTPCVGRPSQYMVSTAWVRLSYVKVNIGSTPKAIPIAVRKYRWTGKTLQNEKCCRNVRYYYGENNGEYIAFTCRGLVPLTLLPSTQWLAFWVGEVVREWGITGCLGGKKKPCTKHWLMISGLRVDVINDPFYSCRSSQRGA